LLIIQALITVDAQAMATYPLPLLSPNKTKNMHLLLLSPILADVDPGAMNSGAIVIVLLSIAAVIRSKMP
jgi:hypothetical protein